MSDKPKRSWRRMRVFFSLCYLVSANLTYFLSAVFLGTHKLLHSLAEEFDTRSVELEAE